MWQNPAAATSAKDKLSSPRHLNQSFQQMTTNQPTFFGSPSDTSIQHQQSQQRIAQLELALARMTQQQILQQNMLQVKERSIQSLQATLHHLEAAQFHEIDDAGMQTEAPPDAHLHSQQ